MALLKAVPQLGMDEQTVDDPEVEAALEERQKRRNSLFAVRKSYEEAPRGLQERAPGAARGGAARVGRFRVTRRAVPARSVSFETRPTSRIQIALTEEE